MIKQILTIALSAACATYASSQTFDEAVTEIALSNPKLHAGILEAKAGVELLRADNSLGATELEFDHKWGSGDAINKLAAGISQSFDWPGLYRARRRVADATADANELLMISEMLNGMLEVKTGLLGIIAARRDLKSIEQQLVLADSLANAYEEAYAAKNITLLELNMAKIERLNLSKQMTEMANLMSERIEAVAALGYDAARVRMLAEKFNDYPDEQLLPLDEYLKQIDELDPQLAYLNRNAEVSHEAVRASKLTSAPGFSLGYGYEKEGPDQFNGFSVGMSLPVWGSSKRTRAAQLEAEAAELRAEAAAIETRSSVTELYDRAVRLRQLVSEYETLIELDWLTPIKQSLDGGQISLIEYLHQVSFLLDAEISCNAVRYDYQVTTAALNRLSLLR